MDQYEFIRTPHRVCEKNIGELPRMTGHSRNTIKKAVHSCGLITVRERYHHF